MTANPTPARQRLTAAITDHLATLEIREAMNQIVGTGWEAAIAASIVEDVFPVVDVEKSDAVGYRSRLVARTGYEATPWQSPDPHPAANCGPLRFSLEPGASCPTCGTVV